MARHATMVRVEVVGRDLRYAGKKYKTGEIFDAREAHASVLGKMGRVKIANFVQPTAPAPAEPYQTKAHVAAPAPPQPTMTILHSDDPPPATLLNTNADSVEIASDTEPAKRRRVYRRADPPSE